MILVLSKPYNPGDTDPGQTYTHLHIESLVYNAEAYVVNIAYSLGTLDTNEYFVKGAAGIHKMAQTTPAQLQEFAMQQCNAGEPALLGAQRLAYQLLTDHFGFAGTLNMALPYDPVFFPNPATAQSTSTSSASSSTPSTPSSTTTPSSTSTSSPSSSTSSASSSSSTSSNTSSNTGATT